jgi:hypothetical protein
MELASSLVYRDVWNDKLLTITGGDLDVARWVSEVENKVRVLQQSDSVELERSSEELSDQVELTESWSGVSRAGLLSERESVCSLTLDWIWRRDGEN